MALVNLQPVLDAVGGDSSVSAVFTATAYKAKRAAPRIDGDTVHFPQPITCNWDGTTWDHAPTLDALPLPYYWHTTVSAGGTRITRDVQLATPVTEVDFADLADIVPDTGEPDVAITQYQATLQQINAAVVTVTSTQQQILATEATLQALIAQANAGVTSITTLLADAQTAAEQAQIDVSAQILTQHAVDITLFDAAGAAAAVTLSGLGGITPAVVDTKIATQHTADVSAFDAAGAAAAAQTASAQKSANLSDLASASSARANLGLGSAATQPASAFDSAGSAAAVTLASLGGITPAGVDTKISAALASIAVLDGNA